MTGLFNNLNDHMKAMAEERRQVALNELAQDLETAWRKYVEVFGQPPRGTRKQLTAMLQFLPCNPITFKRPPQEHN